MTLLSKELFSRKELVLHYDFSKGRLMDKLQLVNLVAGVSDLRISESDKDN